MVPENVVGLIGCCLTAVLYYSGSVSKPLLRGLWFDRIVYSCLCFGQRGLCILLQNKSRTQLISLFVQIVWFFGESKGKFTHIEFTSAMPLFIFLRLFPFLCFSMRMWILQIYLRSSWFTCSTHVSCSVGLELVWSGSRLESYILFDIFGDWSGEFLIVYQKKCTHTKQLYLRCDEVYSTLPSGVMWLFFS